MTKTYVLCLIRGELKILEHNIFKWREDCLSTFYIKESTNFDELLSVMDTIKFI